MSEAKGGPERLGGEIRFPPGRPVLLELAGGRRLRVDRAAGCVELDVQGASGRRLGAAALSGDGALHAAVSQSGESALLARRCAPQLTLVHAPSASTRLVILGDRLPRVEQLELAAVRDAFVVVFENGLVVLGERGEERWRLEQITYGWRLVDEQEGQLFVSDANGNLLGFDLETGLEAEF